MTYSKVNNSLPASLVTSPFYARAGVICDWLSVTCKPQDSFADSLDDWLCGNGFTVDVREKGSTTFRGFALDGVPGGVLRLETNKKFHCASASGGFLNCLRKVGLYRDYVNLVGVVPHKVTRLDAALDVALDSPAILSALCTVYPGEFKFGRKALRTKTIFETRVSDGAITGSWYAGHKSNARISCRVYDKQNERLNRGIIIPPTTRYELTFRKDYGCSLWDALNPSSLFYSHSKDLVDPPAEGFDVWDSKGLVPWVSDPVDTDLTVEKYMRTVEYDAQLKYLAEKGARFGPEGKAILMRRFETLLDSLIAEALHDRVTDEKDAA